jgi:hypothetical protein
VLTFFASGITAPAYTSPAVAPGTTWASTLSAVSGATGVTGYVFAQCNFLFAHAYAFIEDGLGTGSGIAEGYLALEVTTGRAASSGGPESLNN